MSGLIVNIKRLHPNAVIPRYATELAAGFDLVAVEDVIIAPGETALVPLGFAIELPPGYEMQVRPRSGISLRTKLRVANSPGTVDADFRAEIGVIVDNIARPVIWDIDLNLRDVEFLKTNTVTQIDGTTAKLDWMPRLDGTHIIRKGDRIAQGVIAPVERVTFAVVDELSETKRGAGGFGSTGINAEGVNA